MKVIRKISPNANAAVWALALVAGLGMLSMMVALGLGVVQGAEADSRTIGTLFVVGLTLFILGFGGWLAVAQPHKHFDDINVPMYTGHEHDAHGEQDKASH